MEEAEPKVPSPQLGVTAPEMAKGTERWKINLSPLLGMASWGTGKG